MKGLSPAEIVKLVETLLGRPTWKRLIKERYFRGRIASISGSGPYMCTLIRTGETAADGNKYLVLGPRYGPCPGDDVLCVWVDASTAVVLGPVDGLPLSASVGQATGQSIGTGKTTINYDTLLWDPRHCFDSTLTAFICPIAGLYRFEATFRISTGNEIILYFEKNGSDRRVPFLSGTAPGAFIAHGVATMPCEAGDSVTAVGQCPVGAQTTISGIIENWYAVDFVGGSGLAAGLADAL